MEKKDILSGIKVTVDIKKSELACMQCLPPAPLFNHSAYNGILMHSRIDCPEDMIYLINDSWFSSDEK